MGKPLHDDDDDDELDDDELEAAREWPNRAQAAKMAGCTVKTIDSRLRRGEIRAVMVDGVKRYDPSFLVVEETDSESKNKTIEVLNDTVKSLGDQLKQFVNLTLEPNRLILDLLRTENQSVRDQRDKVQEQLTDAIDTMREVLLAKEERELARAQFEASEQRKTEAMKLVASHLPRVVEQLSSNTEIMTLVKGLDKDSLMAMRMTGVLTENQYQAIMRIRGEVPAPVVAPETQQVPADSPPEDTKKQEN